MAASHCRAGRKFVTVCISVQNSTMKHEVAFASKGFLRGSDGEPCDRFYCADEENGIQECEPFCWARCNALHPALSIMATLAQFSGSEGCVVLNSFMGADIMHCAAKV